MPFLRYALDTSEWHSYHQHVGLRQTRREDFLNVKDVLTSEVKGFFASLRMTIWHAAAIMKYWGY